MNHHKLLNWLRKYPWLCLALLAIPSTAYAADGKPTGILGAIDARAFSSLLRYNNSNE
ncbi:MAG: hypothetical protein CLLPBCKN_003023 [Chroococcidiopsis cubana SAG 39.79]|nr:hypothetical protein [Chroococcidiopsis cubana SAG 39.79]